jgi:3-methyl-2-oxobutanoate hydroxymethyltransferase
MQAEGVPITVMTAYDYTSAQLAQLGGVDAVLVGDSLGNVILGYDSTVPVTMDDMVRHTAAVTRTLNGKGPWVFADLPFGAYLTADQAVHNACRLIKEGGAAAVKMEGGSVQPDIMAQTRAVVGAGIPVVGHLGFTPQTVAALGGYSVQGRSAASAVRLMEEALALQEAGCVALVLEMVPSRVATNVTEALDIPTIGIGAGPGTSGQVLVFHDLVGLFDKFTPKFAPRFAEAGQVMRQGVEAYQQQVKAGTFPDPKMHGYAIPEADFAEFQAATAHLRKERRAPRPPGGTKRSMSTWAAAGGHIRSMHAAPRPERVAILGGGALGSLLAGHLAKVDHVQVTRGVAIETTCEISRMGDDGQHAKRVSLTQPHLTLNTCNRPFY